jgi:hypothetical protein
MTTSISRRPDGRSRYKRRLTVAQVKAAWKLYETGLSLRQIGALIWERHGFASPGSAAMALLAAFHAEGYVLRDRVAASVARSTVHGLGARGSRSSPAYLEHRRKLRRERGDVRDVRCAGARTQYPRKGERCRRPAVAGSDFCVSHDPARAVWRDENLARARARRGSR